MAAETMLQFRLKSNATVWEYLAQPDEELERVDIVALDLAVARGIECFKNLDVDRYVNIVDHWTKEFAQRLPASEEFFWKKGPEKWKNDIRFYRVGMLQTFIGQAIGIRYIEEQRHVKSISYTTPGDLFINGLIDTKAGTCGNMATLHVAMARRMGWPVSLACIQNHKLSRFDDGEVVYNIECAFNEQGGFSEGSDADYLKKFNLPKKAIESGSDLRKLTAREMIAIFLSHRARYYRDIGKRHLCDVDCSLSRALYPSHRSIYELALLPFIEKGERIFNQDEQAHPRNQCRDIFAQDFFNPLVGTMKIVHAPPSVKEPTVHTSMIGPMIVNGVKKV